MIIRLQNLVLKNKLTFESKIKKVLIFCLQAAHNTHLLTKAIRTGGSDNNTTSRLIYLSRQNGYFFRIFYTNNWHDIDPMIG